MWNFFHLINSTLLDYATGWTVTDIIGWRLIYFYDYFKCLKCILKKETTVIYQNISQLFFYFKQSKSVLHFSVLEMAELRSFC